MTIAEAQKRVEQIRAMAGDDEAAHSAEDHFRLEVLTYLGEVAPAELGWLARLAASTEQIDFERWCA